MLTRSNRSQFTRGSGIKTTPAALRHHHTSLNYIPKGIYWPRGNLLVLHFPIQSVYLRISSVSSSRLSQWAHHAAADARSNVLVVCVVSAIRCARYRDIRACSRRRCCKASLRSSLHACAQTTRRRNVRRWCHPEWTYVCRVVGSACSGARAAPMPCGDRRARTPFGARGAQCI